MTNKKEEVVNKSVVDRIIELYLSLLLISDSKKLVNENKKHHLISIYGQLRALITDNSQINAKRSPILLALSKILQIELKFFYSSAMEKYLAHYDIKDFEFCHFSFEFSETKLNSRHKETELNDFLDKNIFIFNKKPFNFRKIINGLSDKFGGSHYDPTLPKDFANLSNLHMGDLPVLDKYIQEFSDILLPISLKIPKSIADFELFFSFILFTNPSEEVVLFDITLPNRYFRIVLTLNKYHGKLSLTDLVGKKAEFQFDMAICFNKKIMFSFSHSINKQFESEINLFKNGKSVKFIKSQPLLLYNKIYSCEISLNKAIFGMAQKFKFGIFHLGCISKILTPEARTNYISTINEFNLNPLKIPERKYAKFLHEKKNFEIIND